MRYLAMLENQLYTRSLRVPETLLSSSESRCLFGTALRCLQKLLYVFAQCVFYIRLCVLKTCSTNRDTGRIARAVPSIIF